jgi:iron complex outermembrane recepter protein
VKNAMPCLSIAATVSAILAAAATPAWAADSETDELDEVVVTAQFISQNLQETPLAITAITGDMLEARSQTKIADITAQTPNVILQVNPAGGGNSMRAYIRGVGQGDQSPSVDPGVGIYVDDVYFATITASVFELLDLDRVEILRGPQGTLNGMNSMGGSVRMFSRKPTGDGGFLEATMGSLDRRELRGSGDFEILPDQLYARVSGMARQRDGYVTRLDYACSHPDDPYVISGAISRGNSGTDCKMGTLGGQSLAAVRGALRWLPSDALEVNLVADATTDKSETQASVLRQAGEIIPGLSLSYQGVPYDNRFVPYGPSRGDTVNNDPYITYANFINPGTTWTPLNPAGDPGAPNGIFYAEPASEMKGWGISNTIDWRLGGDNSLKFITGYRKYKTLSGQDNDGSPVAILQSLSEFTHDQFSQEIRFSGQALNDRLDYTLGGIYFKQETVYASRESDPFIPFGTDPFNRPTFDFIQHDTTDNEFKGIFLHTVWHLTDKLNMAAGVRYTEQNKDYEFQRLAVDGISPFQQLSDPSNPLNGRIGNFNGSHTDYRVNFDYQWNDDLMTYIQFATGFKGGGISPRPYFPEQVLGFGTEELDAYELGVKSRWFGRVLQVNAAVFKNDYKGYQATPTQCVDEDGEILPLPFGTPNLCGQYLNVADADVKGVEVELELRPLDGLLIDVAWSYLDFKFGAPYIDTNAVIEGASAPGLGKRKWSLGAQYTMAFGSGATLTPRLDVFHTPGYCGDLNCTPLNSNDAYNLVNARVTYRSAESDWNVSLEVTNLTDKLYDLNKFNSVYASSQPGTPRLWGVSVRRRF